MYFLDAFSKRIVLGDTSTHGGRVSSARSETSYGPYQYARSGDSVYCPKCGGYYRIEQGPLDHYGRELPYAVEGQRTSCGATLVSRDSLGLVMRDDDTIASVFSDFRATNICEYINKYKSRVTPYGPGGVFSNSGGSSVKWTQNTCIDRKYNEVTDSSEFENIQYTNKCRLCKKDVD
ncbi:MAG: PAAR domain-containing protein [Desulfovibrio sp.]|nr:PAAR domain-containing protein [Desulfovibrio sp.]